jgi:acyl-CoA thioester hydrolase
MSRLPPGRRADYRYFHAITTRWMDNDVFRHVNNVNYFSFFDTAVTYYEMTNGVVDLLDGPVHCVVAEVMCRYHSSVAFPDRIMVGVRVARIGGSSVRYEIGVFRNDDDEAAAEGYFVHVFVDRSTQRPAAVPAASRAILETIAVTG